ncbi:MlaD family protein [Desulfovibrio inopinatus]|uniref:MlaD family protein n=1 Tax=Desulfovibrio inopinatus TaxID=102109 RepID=UPI0003F5F1A6|nr:MlaD family protein [Desulfovibrio inopinatus]
MQTQSSKKMYVKAWIMLGLGIAVLSAFIVVLGGLRFWETLTPYSIYFKSVKDLTPGQPVKYGGLSVGRIESIVVDPANPGRLRVDIGIKERFPLYQGTVASISQKGLVGDYYIYLELRGHAGEKLTKDAVIPAEESISMQQLAAEVGQLFEELKPKLVNIAQGIESLVESLNTADLNTTLANAPKLIDEATQTVVSVRQDFSNLVLRANTLGDRVDGSLDIMDNSVVELKNDVKKTLASLRTQLDNAGKLVNSLDESVAFDQEQVETILLNVEKATRDLKFLMQRLRERPWEIIIAPK